MYQICDGNLRFRAIEMIVRDINLDDLSNFDFYNNGKDTIHYLRALGRVDDAARLQRAFKRWARAQRRVKLKQVIKKESW